MNIQELPVVKLPESATELRKDVRDFINREYENGLFEKQCDSWLAGFSPQFSERLGDKGWIGISLPEKYGGSNGTVLDRFIITEELLSAGAPVAAHWVADRQTAPLLLNYGTEEQKEKFLPEICKGKCFFSIGLSESNAGSDLASISTKAELKNDKWVINGSKIWSSGAHKTNYMIVLCRTSKIEEKKHEGLSQIIVDLNSPGITIRPIKLITGEHHFNEVIFEDVEISKEMLIGEVGNGWKQGMTELAFERSGPERFLSTYPLLHELVMLLKENSNTRNQIEIGKLIAKLWTLRKMSLGIAYLLNEGISSNITASIVKDLGTQFENEVINVSRQLVNVESINLTKSAYERHLSRSILHSPGFTLRGGTTEILRSIISKGVGL